MKKALCHKRHRKAKQPLDRQIPEQDERWRAVDDYSPALVCYIDAQFHLRLINRQFERWLGRSRAEILGQPLGVIMGDSAMGKLRPYMERALQGGEAEFNDSLSLPDGRFRWARMRFVPRRGEGTQIPGFYIFGLDLAELKEAQAALNERESRLHMLTETMPAVPWSATPDGFIEYFSHRWLEWTGQTREEALGAGWKEVIHPEDLLQIFAKAKQSMETGMPFEVEYRLLRRDGTLRWHRSRALPERDEAGKIVRWHGITFEVHELKAALDAVRENELRLRLAVDTAALGLYERNLITNEVTLDSALRRIMGLADGPVAPDVARRSLFPEDRERVLAVVVRAFDPRFRDVCSAEFRIIRPNGQVRWVAGRGRVVFDDTVSPPRPVKFLGVLRDITERKRAEESLAQHSVILERLVEERTARLRQTIQDLEHFSYSITHDLRAPLRAMQSFAMFLEEEFAVDAPPQAVEYLRRIQNAASRMDKLILDSLDYTKILRGELPVSPVDVGALVRGMVDSYPEFQPPAADITVDIHQVMAMGNEAGLTQCFSNLLGNAVKFVAPGVKPSVHVWAETREKKVRIWIEDNGIGIPREAQQKIFEMFQRLHPESDYPGTGIGLSLVRKGMQRMGGEVGFESEAGKGSKFWIELPKVVEAVLA